MQNCYYIFLLIFEFNNFHEIMTIDLKVKIRLDHVYISIRFQFGTHLGYSPIIRDIIVLLEPFKLK